MGAGDGRKNKNGKRRPIIERSLPIYLFAGMVCRQISLYVMSLEASQAIPCTTQCGARRTSALLFFRRKGRGHPSVGVVGLTASNFGGGTGCKTCTGGIGTASSGAGIRQCRRACFGMQFHHPSSYPATMDHTMLLAGWRPSKRTRLFG